MLGLSSLAKFARPLPVFFDGSAKFARPLPVFFDNSAATRRTTIPFCSAMQCKLSHPPSSLGKAAPTRPDLGALRLTQQTKASAGGPSRPSLG
eukprot:6143243-Amphidinium_carterae.1